MMTFAREFSLATFSATVTNAQDASFAVYAAGAIHAHVVTWDAARTDLKRALIALHGGRPANPEKPNGTDEQTIAICKKLHEQGIVAKFALQVTSNSEETAMSQLATLIVQHLIETYETKQRLYVELVRGKTLDEVKAEADAKKALKSQKDAQEEGKLPSKGEAVPLPSAENFSAAVTALVGDIYKLVDSVPGEISADITRLFSLLDGAELRAMLTAHSEYVASVEKVAKAA